MEHRASPAYQAFPFQEEKACLASKDAALRAPAMEYMVVARGPREPEGYIVAVQVQL